MTDHPHPADDGLQADDLDTIGLLRLAMRELPTDLLPSDDDPPESLHDGAVWIHDWLTMEAELAELTFDSVDQPELAGVRSTGALRELTFVSDASTIEIEIEPGVRSAGVSGTITPPVAGRVQLVVGAEIYAGEIDARGAFAIAAVPHGTVLALVDTAHGKIRLGSFEL